VLYDLAMMTTQNDDAQLTRLARIARITGAHVVLPDGTRLVFDALPPAPAELEQQLAAEAATSPETSPEAPRLARGSTPPPTPPETSPTALPRADVRRGGFRADVSDDRLKGRRVLMRKWQGKVIRVEVDRAAGGFVYDGQLWPSLSSIARRVCGHNRNGWEFFGLEARR
jgi:hypothetical protein